MVHESLWSVVNMCRAWVYKCFVCFTYLPFSATVSYGVCANRRFCTGFHDWRYLPTMSASRRRCSLVTTRDGSQLTFLWMAPRTSWKTAPRNHGKSSMPVCYFYKKLHTFYPHGAVLVRIYATTWSVCVTQTGNASMEHGAFLQRFWNGLLL